MNLTLPSARHAAPARRTGLAAVAALVLAATAAVTGSVASAAAPAAAAAIGVPTAVAAVPGNNTARVTWLPPLGIDPLTTSYEVTAWPGGQRVVVGGDELGATVRFLTNGQAYTFTVAAFDFDDIGPLSAPSLPVTPLDVCTILGTPGDDVLTGTPGDDAICGLGGNDTLRGSAGGDTFVGGAGSDTIDFGSSTERVFASLAGAPFNLTTLGLGWADGDGSDVLRRDIESISGSAYSDVLEGNDDANTMVGRGGADLFRGWAGNDVISGGAGNDELWGLSGDDHLVGADGNDVFYPLGDSDVVDGGPGSDTVVFTRAVTVDLQVGTAQGMSTDQLLGVENITGSNEPDVLLGSTAANVLRGGGGDDQLAGRGANDKLYGDDGNDALDGGLGTADSCDGGLDTDTAKGCESVLSVP